MIMLRTLNRSIVSENLVTPQMEAKRKIILQLTTGFHIRKHIKVLVLSTKDYSLRIDPDPNKVPM